jgi:hypothetical protein
LHSFGKFVKMKPNEGFQHQGQGVNALRTFRTLMLSLSLILPASAALAATPTPTPGYLTQFQIDAPASVPAGSIFGVTITGQDGSGSVVSDFVGTVSLNCSSGAGTFSPTVSGAFNGTQWIGGPNLRIYTAGTITFTCSTGGTLNATGSAIINVTPLAQDRTIMIFEGQTYTPGLAPGYTPITPRPLKVFRTP